MRDILLILSNVLKKRAIEEGRLDFNTKRNTLTKYISEETKIMILVNVFEGKGFYLFLK
jgi:hypothetical protein